jgi:hypothetical protein
VEKVQVSLKSGRNNGTLHEDQYIFLTISGLDFLRIRNVSDKIRRENQNTNFVMSFFLSEIVPFMRC